MKWCLIVTLAGLVLLAACDPELRGRNCEEVSDCTYQETCVDGRCVPLDANDAADGDADEDAGEEASDTPGSGDGEDADAD